MQIRLLPSTLLFAFASIAHAGPVYVDYTLNLGSGTLNGNSVTSVMILERAGDLVNLDFPHTVAGSGVFLLSHVAPFVPTSSLIIGLDLPSTTGGDDKTHIVMFTNNEFATGANGLLFSVAFPHTRHNDFISRFLQAEAGDATQTAWITDFFLTGDGSSAAFATGTQSTAMEFSISIILVPEPQTFVFVGLGLAALIAARRFQRIRAKQSA